MLDIEFKVDPTGTVQTPAPQPGEIIYCRPAQLRQHPENMRRNYPAADVHKMRDSIKAEGGVIESLKIVPDPQNPDGYLVVDGNMRLAGGRSLGKNCPPLKCEVISADRARQLLIMVITSKFHFPKGPISEALHYQRLHDEEGYTWQAIADAVGCHVRTIEARIKLLDLDEPVQALVAAGKLSKDVKFADALTAIPSREARVKLAEQLAAKNAGLKMSVAACNKLAAAVAPAKEKRPTPEGPRVQDVKIYTRLTDLVFDQFIKNAKLLDAAAQALPPEECELAEQLAAQADALRGIIDRTFKRGEMLKAKAAQ